MKEETKKVEMQTPVDEALSEAEFSATESKNKKDDKISFKNVTRGALWEYQENDIFKMLKKAGKEADFFETYTHYLSMIKGAFSVERYEENDTPAKMSLEKQGYKLGTIKVEDKVIGIALKKKAIKRVTDFTYENIRHISAAKMLEVISNNFGGGWDSISQSIRDIIESGFDISTTTLPSDRLHKEGGLYERKIADGCEVLEIQKGTWTEAIFAKVRPLVEIPKMTLTESTSLDNEDEDEDDIRDEYADDIDMNDEDTDDMNEENYRTTFAISEEDEDGDVSLDDLDD